MPESRPGAIGNEGDQFVDILVDRVRQGSCVLLLGPHVAVDPGQLGEVPLATLLSRELAGLPEVSHSIEAAGKDNLRYVAEMVERSSLDRDQLELAVRDFYRRFQGATTAFHRDLAALPFSLFVSTTPDELMLEALRLTPGKRPGLFHYNFRRAAKAQPQPPNDTEPVVYQLYGSAVERESLVLTETDLVDFLVNVVKNVPPLPEWMRALFTKSETAFLFLGFGFQNWYLRVLLHVLGMMETGHRPGYALEDRTFFEDPGHQQTIGFFRGSGKGGIKFQQASWREFAARLRAAYEASVEGSAARPSEPGPEAPLAFLSYADEDREVAEGLAAQLRGRGVRVWRDKDDLRGGDRWAQVIDRVIGHADYVVVVQSNAMARRVKGVFNEEIVLALEQQRQHAGGIRFVVPVAVDESPPRPDLAEFHLEDLRRERGVDTLARAILEDWAERARRKGAAPAAG